MSNEEIIEVEVEAVSDGLRPFTVELSPREMWIYSIPEDPSYYQKWIQISSGWLGGAKYNKNASNWYGKLKEQLGEIASWYLVNPETGLFRPTLLYELIKIQDFTQEQTVLRQSQPVPEQLRSQFLLETSVRVINEFDTEAGAYTSNCAPNPNKPKDWTVWKAVQQARVRDWHSTQTSTIVVATPTAIQPESLEFRVSAKEVRRIGDLQNKRSSIEEREERRKKALLKREFEKGQQLRLAVEEARAAGYEEMDQMLDEDPS